MIRFGSRSFVVGVLLWLCLAAAHAQSYPSRPVRMVVPFPPGSASDFLARVLGQKLGEAWGQQIVVDNRPGAGGLIGGTVVAKSNPDGYTIALIGQPHLTAYLLFESAAVGSVQGFHAYRRRCFDAERNASFRTST